MAERIGAAARPLLRPQLAVWLVHDLEREAPAVDRVAVHQPAEPLPVVPLGVRARPTGTRHSRGFSRFEWGVRTAAVLAGPVGGYAGGAVGPAREQPSGEDHVEAGGPGQRDLLVHRLDVAVAAPRSAGGRVVRRAVEIVHRHEPGWKELGLVPPDPEPHPARPERAKPVQVAVDPQVLDVATVVERVHGHALGQAAGARGRGRSAAIRRRARRSRQPTASGRCACSAQALASGPRRRARPARRIPRPGRPRGSSRCSRARGSGARA